MKRSASTSAFVALLLLVPCVGCPASAGVGSGAAGSAGGAGVRSYDQFTLRDACAASCKAQAATQCPGVLPASDCSASCLDLQGALTCNPDVWRDLNACMATAPLSCDRVNGGTSVSSEDCGSELDAFQKCL